MGATPKGIKSTGEGLVLDPETNPWWVEANNNGLLSEPVIGLQINPAAIEDPDSKRSPGGKLTIG